MIVFHSECSAQLIETSFSTPTPPAPHPSARLVIVLSHMHTCAGAVAFALCILGFRSMFCPAFPGMCQE